MNFIILIHYVVQRSRRSMRCVVCNIWCGTIGASVYVCMCAHDIIWFNTCLWAKKSAKKRVHTRKEGVRHPTDISVFNVKSKSNSIANHHHHRRRSCDLLQSDNCINHKKKSAHWKRLTFTFTYVQYRLLSCQLCYDIVKLCFPWFFLHVFKCIYVISFHLSFCSLRTNQKT